MAGDAPREIRIEAGTYTGIGYHITDSVKIIGVDKESDEGTIAGGWDVKIEEEYADINQDGVINAKDVTTLRRYLVDGWGIIFEVLYLVDSM